MIACPPSIAPKNPPLLLIPFQMNIETIRPLWTRQTFLTVGLLPYFCRLDIIFGTAHQQSSLQITQR